MDSVPVLLDSTLISGLVSFIKLAMAPSVNVGAVLLNSNVSLTCVTLLALSVAITLMVCSPSERSLKFAVVNVCEPSPLPSIAISVMSLPFNCSNTVLLLLASVKP